MQKKGRIFNGLLLLSIFLFILLFFYKIHPIIISDTDDWTYSYMHRSFRPYWKSWNPTRVLAETMMPLVSSLGAYCIYPITGKYFESLTFVYALCMAFFFSLLIMYLIDVIRTYYTNMIVIIYSILFFVLSNFWIFCNGHSNNYYMLWSIDGCTYFYYVIPNLINCALVCYYIKKTSLKIDYSSKMPLTILFLYLSIFSNIWSSIILATYIGARLFFDLLETIIVSKKNIIVFIKNNTLAIVYLFVWFVSQIFEMNGGRANNLSKGNFGEELTKTICRLIETIFSIRKPFAVVVIVILFGGLVFIVKRKKKDLLKLIATLVFAIVVQTIYLLLSCAKTGAWYVTRTDVLYGVFFFLMLIVLICFNELVIDVKWVELLVPILLVYILFDCNSSGKVFAESNVGNREPAEVYATDYAILNQIEACIENGDETMVLHLPKYDHKENWPYMTYYKEVYIEHLYKYGVVGRTIDISEAIADY